MIWVLDILERALVVLLWRELTALDVKLGWYMGRQVKCVYEKGVLTLGYRVTSAYLAMCKTEKSKKNRKAEKFLVVPNTP